MFLQKKDNFDEIPVDKRRKIGGTKMVGQAASGRTRQAFSVVNVAQDLSMRSDSAGNGGSDYGSVDFSKEDVEALLNEKMKGKYKSDYKVSKHNGPFLIFFFCVLLIVILGLFFFFSNLQGKCEQMTEYIKKLRLCIKWFQELEASYVTEREKNQTMIDSLEKKCDEIGKFSFLLFYILSKKIYEEIMFL